MKENILSFAELAGDRLRESVDDLELFNFFLDSLGTTEELMVTFATDPSDLITDHSMFAFTVNIDGVELRFHASLIDDEIEKALSYDPYYIDVSYLTDVHVTDLEKDEVIDTLDAISGFYVDPIRPFNWLIDKNYFDSDATIEAGAITFLSVVKDYFHLEIDRKSHIRLVVDNTKS